MMRGIDVSVCQGRIQWPSLAPLGLAFAIVKCAEGTRPAPDPNFRDNVDGARALGLRVGCYHFAYPLPHLDPREQARAHFAQSMGMGAHQGDLPPALDLEWPPPDEWGKWGCSPDQIRSWSLAYLDEARILHGVPPLLYIDLDFFMHIGGPREPAFAQSPLWISAWPMNPVWPAPPSRPPVPRPWPSWLFWQFTGGKIRLPDGMPADFDVFNGDQAALDALCVRGSTPDTPTLPDLPQVAILDASDEIPEADHEEPPEVKGS